LTERWHNLQHEAEDAELLSAARAAGHPLDHAPIHDENNCEIHCQLHISILAVAWVPLLICPGLFLAFLTLLPVRLPLQLRQVVIPCRGPPAL
jgi:hypothetical protein